VNAAVYEQYGPPEVVEIKEVPKPVPKDNEILIKIMATTLHRGDSRIRGMDVPGGFIVKLMFKAMMGISAPRSKILGIELSGIVEEVGKNVTKYKSGDEVFASSYAGYKFGAHAEYICLPENGMIAPKPSNMSHEEATPVPGSGCAVLIYLRNVGKLQTGEHMLINGASGALGTYGVQIAKYLGAEVTGVCSTANLELVKSIGADYVIDYTQQDFTKTGNKYDLVFDAVSMSSKKDCQDILTSKGRYIRTDGPEPKREDLLFLKDIIEAGKMKTVIDREYPLDEIVEAHRYVEKGHKRGNVVIKVTEAP
jgi:NADPH:quinone reductase-like Zn-dependent oxidoreductase